MSLTLAELISREEALAREIAERQKLLAAYQLIRADSERALGAAGDTVSQDEPKLGTRTEPATPCILPAPAIRIRSGSGQVEQGLRWRHSRGDMGHPADGWRLHCAQHRRGTAAGGVSNAGGESFGGLEPDEDEGKITEVATGRGRTPSLFRANDLTAAVPLQLAARHRASGRAMLLQGAV